MFRFGILDLQTNKIVYSASTRPALMRWLHKHNPSLVNHRNKQGHYLGGQMQPKSVLPHEMRIVKIRVPH